MSEHIECPCMDCATAPSKAPRVEDEAERHEANVLIFKLDELPDYYTPGADGGYYHALDPKRARPLVIEALCAAERRGMERAAEIAEKWGRGKIAAEIRALVEAGR